MTMHTALRRMAIERLAWLAILLVVMRVLGWELHQLAERHPLGEVCEVCLVADRSGDGLIAPPAAAPVQAGAVAPRPLLARLPQPGFAPCPPSRGPPILQG